MRSRFDLASRLTPAAPAPSLAWLSLVCVLGCGSPGASNSSAATGGATAASSNASAAPNTRGAASATSAPSTGTQQGKGACTPWGNAPQGFLARTSAGRADFFREFQYDFESGVLHVHDSDPFATGPETKDPRVLHETKTLEGAEKAKLEAAMLAICPDETALKASCAPGGCSRLEVKQNGGAMSNVEHSDSVGKIFVQLEPFFPKLRIAK